MQHSHSHSHSSISRSPARHDHSTEAYKELVHAHIERYPSAWLYCQRLLSFLPGRLKHLQTLQTVDITQTSVQDPEHPIHVEAELRAPQDHPRITFVAGFPSPENLAEVGVHYNVRPELFITHLETNIHDDYLIGPTLASGTQAPMSFFELPQLPSSLTSVVNIRLATLCRSRDHREPTLPSSEERQEVERRTQEYQDQQFETEQYGSTRFRKVHMHNSQYFSVEQMVSFWVNNPKGRPWQGLILHDKGRSLKNRFDLPWASYGKENGQPSMVPAISFSTKTGPKRATSAGQHTPSADELHPYDPLNDLYASDTEELELLRQNPFFLLSRLLFTAAQSWSQFLNHLGRDINYCLKYLDAEPSQLFLALGQLRYNASLLARVEGFLEDNKRLIEQQGSHLWPRSTDSSMVKKIQEIQNTLDRDHEFLLKTCVQLSARCERYQDILVSAAQTIDAQKGVEQASRSHKLTRLAFIFIPLAFVASLFGMSIDILEDNPPWWYYFVISVPLTFTSWIISDWKQVSLARFWEKCKQLTKRRLDVLHRNYV